MKRSDGFRFFWPAGLWPARAAWLGLLLGLVSLLAATTASAELRSEFFRNDPNAQAVIAGTPYNMDDPQFRTGVTFEINRDSFSFKILRALYMLGFQTEASGAAYQHPLGFNRDQLFAFHNFQRHHGLPMSSLLSADLLQQIDDELFTRREPYDTAVAARFPFYPARMLPLHPHEVSLSYEAAQYQRAYEALPEYLQFNALNYEILYCHEWQCVGDIFYADGNHVPRSALDPSATNQFFAGAYFASANGNNAYVGSIGRIPSAGVNTFTILHEYAHYLDRWAYGSGYSPDPQVPHQGLIDTAGFYNIGWNLSDVVDGSCYKRRSQNPQDYISGYGFNGSVGRCQPSQTGRAYPAEDFAEDFAFYVTNGRSYRAAAAVRPQLAQTYNWLKTNVFQGREYDTDLNNSFNSTGCFADGQYAPCGADGFWDGNLPILDPAADQCPSDPYKTEPGSCGCGTPELWAPACKPVTLNSPNGGEIARPGSPFSLNIGLNRAAPGSIKVELLKGGALHSTVAENLTAGGIIPWSVPADLPGGADYRMRVSHTAHPGVADTSDADFSVDACIYNPLKLAPGTCGCDIPDDFAPSCQTFQVTAPTSGSTLYHGQQVPITWNRGGYTGGTVRIELVESGFFTNILAVLAENAPNTGSYQWNVDGSVGTGQGRYIRVTPVAFLDNSPSLAVLSGEFTLATDQCPADPSKSAPGACGCGVPDAWAPYCTASLTVTAPNGGETFRHGDSVTVRWDRQGGALGGAVRIELLKGGVLDRVLTENYPNLGVLGVVFHPWIQVGSDYQIRITHLDYPSVTDTSNANFTIAPAVCPSSQPTDGSSCTAIGQVCSYGQQYCQDAGEYQSSVNAYCTASYKWTVQPRTCSLPQS